MEDNKIICPNCHSKIRKTNKFCPKCGTKNDQFENISNETNSNSTVAVQAVEVTNNTSLINQTSNVSNSETINNNSTTVTTTSKKSRTPFFVGVSAAVIALIAVSIVLIKTVFASPDSIVNTALANTFSSLINNNNDFTNAPTFYGLLNKFDDNCVEKELSLNYKDMDLGYNIDTSSLKDYGAKIKLQLDPKNLIGNLRLSIKHNDEDFVTAMLNLTKDKIAVNSPELLDNALALNLEDENSDLKSIQDFSDILSKQTELIDDVKTSFIKILPEFYKDVDKLINFEKDKSDKNLYTATITEEDIDKLIIKYSKELTKNDAFKKYYAYTLYLNDDMSEELSYYEKQAENEISDLLDNLQSYLDEVETDDIIIEMEIPNKKGISNMTISTTLTSGDESVDFRFSIDADQGENSSFYTAKLNLGTEYDGFTLKIKESFEKVGNTIARKIKLNANGTENEIIFVINDSLDKKEKTTSSYTQFQINEDYENYNFSLSVDGNYTSDDTLNFDDLELQVSNGYDEFNINLSGYITSKSINKLDSIDTTDMVYINDMDDDDVEDLGYNVLFKLYRILQLLGISTNI